MGYSNGHPIHLVGGRLALDFCNTADWRADGTICHEKLESLADLHVWAADVGLPKARLPRTLTDVHQLRAHVRSWFVSRRPQGSDRSRWNRQACTESVNQPLNKRDRVLPDIKMGSTKTRSTPGVKIGHRPLIDLTAVTAVMKPTHALLERVTMSTLGILADPRERARIKLCPGADCGWIFFDETRNARRTWCMMETCGNRAKAARHYARRLASRRPS